MHIHSLGTRFIAAILFSGHSLMGCSGVVGADPKRLKEEIITHSYHELSGSTDISLSEENELALFSSYKQEANQTIDRLPAHSPLSQEQEVFIARELVGKTLEPQLGQQLTFYREAGILKGKTLTHSGLDVYMGEVKLGQRLRARHIHVVSAKQDKNKKGYVYIDQGGLRGGMMENEEEDNNNPLREIPHDFFCPITQEVMEDPVIAQDGHTYERAAILKWFAMGKNTSPKTGGSLLNTELLPNHTMRSLIEEVKAKIHILSSHKVDMSSKESSISGKVEIHSGVSSINPKVVRPEVAVKKFSKEEIDQLVIEARENNLEALNRVTLIAERDNSYAQLKLSKMYQEGKRVIENDQKAVYWCQKAAEQGNSEAEYTLGLMYEDGQVVEKDDQKAVYWIRKAAEQGHAEAQYTLGMIYKTKTADFYDNSYRGYLFSQSQGWKNSIKSEAEAHIERLFSKGAEGVEKNDKKAAYWFQKAAEQGYAKAQHALGLMYQNGQGVEQDYQKAVEWYQKAAEQGYAEAKYRIAKAYEKAYEETNYRLLSDKKLPEIIQAENEKKAVEWYQKAAEEGHAKAQYELGLIYSQGRNGIAQDYKKAVEWYQKAADNGHELAKYRVTENTNCLSPTCVIS